MQLGKDGFMRYASERAAGKWYSATVIPLLCSSSDASVMVDKLGLTPRQAHPVSMDCKEQWFLDEIDFVKQYRTFTVNLAFHESWSQLMYTMCFPQKMEVMAHTCPKMRQLGCMYMKRLTAAIVKAEELCTTNPAAHEKLRTFLNQASFIGEYFSRYTMAKGIKESWDKDSRELIRTGELMTAGSSTTADCLEKTFASMADRSRVYAKNKKMCRMATWFYLSANPYVSKGGMPEVQTTVEDYMASAGHFCELGNEVTRKFMSRQGILCQMLANSFMCRLFGSGHVFLKACNVVRH